ncbi:SpoIIE family protein phosphatase [Vibrio ouci]|uniref:Serine/threonine protein phosphatase n=1 Tax=Vibrio ouci TaxID=2499078 RepID=A0A4Y8WJ65_9VIBR|nr:SpoIIE family protein phosphatase [Vibrio ouci]TFH92696.1 serine/threonine protein phosphatase [Vibrio ouci]
MGFEYSVHCLPYQGELETGDGYYVARVGDDLLVVIIDVLGHGPEAASLARSIEVTLEQIACKDIKGMMSDLHQKLSGTLGAAITVVYFDSGSQEARGIGIGNTLVRQLGQNYRSFSAQAGIVGELMPTLRPFEFRFEFDETYLFTTDGVKENIDPTEVEFANGKALDYLSSFFVRSFSKSYDDATAILVRYCNE